MIILRESIQKKCKEFLSVIKEASTDDKKKFFLIEYKRWLCRNDMFFLSCITGHENVRKWASFYTPFCDKASLQIWKVVQLGIHAPSDGMLAVNTVVSDPIDLKVQRMFLCYRAFYKTTFVTKIKSLMLLLNFHNIHFVLCHNKQENASDNLVTVKNLFLNKPELSKETLDFIYKEYGIIYPSNISELFPECIPSTKDWGNMTGFSVAKRTDWNRMEENIEAVGVDTEVTGRHWQLAIKNDLVTEKSVNTEEQRNKTANWDARFNSGLFDDGQNPLQDYEGTRYHFSDLYSVKKNDNRIEVVEIPVVQDLKKFMEGDDSQITHAERYNRDGIKSLMSDMWVFMTQMMMKPEDPDKMQFKKDMIQYFNAIPSGVYNYGLIDPASARKKRSDYTVILNVAVIKRDGKILKYVTDGVRDKLDPKQRVDMVIEMAKKHEWKDMAWEAIGFQDTDCYYFEEERRRQGLRISPTPIKSHATAKEDRIRGLVPEYVNGEWFWPDKGKCVKRSQWDGKNYDLTVQMEEELSNFPLAEHDDLLDAQTFLNRLNIGVPEYKESVEEVTYTTFSDYHKIIAESKKKNPWDTKKESYV